MSLRLSLAGAGTMYGSWIDMAGSTRRARPGDWINLTQESARRRSSLLALMRPRQCIAIWASDSQRRVHGSPG